MRVITTALHRLIRRWGARPYVICPLIHQRRHLIVSDEKAILEPPAPSVLQRGPRCRRLRGANGEQGNYDYGTAPFGGLLVGPGDPLHKDSDESGT